MVILRTSDMATPSGLINLSCVNKVTDQTHSHRYTHNLSRYTNLFEPLNINYFDPCTKTNNVYPVRLCIDNRG